MKTLEQRLTQYAAYHRDPRNILTHFVGVPMILFAIVVLLSRPVLFHAVLPVTVALISVIGLALYYLRLHAGVGCLMALVLAVMLLAAQRIALLPTAVWLGWGVGLFVVGWIVQAVGHVYEKRKPAFLDDLMGLIIGPVFVMCELLFAIGRLQGLRTAIERQVGPTRPWRRKAPA